MVGADYVKQQIWTGRTRQEMKAIKTSIHKREKLINEIEQSGVHIRKPLNLDEAMVRSDRLFNEKSLIIRKGPLTKQDLHEFNEMVKGLDKGEQEALKIYFTLMFYWYGWNDRSIHKISYAIQRYMNGEKITDLAKEFLPKTYCKNYFENKYNELKKSEIKGVVPKKVTKKPKIKTVTEKEKVEAGLATKQKLAEQKLAEFLKKHKIKELPRGLSYVKELPYQGPPREGERGFIGPVRPRSKEQEETVQQEVIPKETVHETMTKLDMGLKELENQIKQENVNIMFADGRLGIFSTDYTKVYYLSKDDAEQIMKDGTLRKRYAAIIKSVNQISDNEVRKIIVDELTKYNNTYNIKTTEPAETVEQVSVKKKKAVEKVLVEEEKTGNVLEKLEEFENYIDYDKKGLLSGLKSNIEVTSTKYNDEKQELSISIMNKDTEKIKEYIITMPKSEEEFDKVNSILSATYAYLLRNHKDLELNELCKFYDVFNPL